MLIEAHVRDRRQTGVIRTVMGGVDLSGHGPKVLVFASQFGHAELRLRAGT